jgi:hypothetical protein
MLEGRVMQQSKAYKKYINRIKDEFVEAENWGSAKWMTGNGLLNTCSL